MHEKLTAFCPNNLCLCRRRWSRILVLFSFFAFLSAIKVDAGVVVTAANVRLKLLVCSLLVQFGPFRSWRMASKSDKRRKSSCAPKLQVAKNSQHTDECSTAASEWRRPVGQTQTKRPTKDEFPTTKVFMFVLFVLHRVLFNAHFFLRQFSYCCVRFWSIVPFIAGSFCFRSSFTILSDLSFFIKGMLCSVFTCIDEIGECPIYVKSSWWDQCG